MIEGLDASGTETEARLKQSLLANAKSLRDLDKARVKRPQRDSSSSSMLVSRASVSISGDVPIKGSSKGCSLPSRSVSREPYVGPLWLAESGRIAAEQAVAADDPAAGTLV